MSLFFKCRKCGEAFEIKPATVDLRMSLLWPQIEESHLAANRAIGHDCEFDQLQIKELTRFQYETGYGW